jgi:putative ABC transport system permease protein
MNFVQSFWEALESLSANKMRSGLTVLGIVIGVAAVIAMISIGRGAENTITGSIQGIGTNLIFVFSGGSEEARNVKPITFGDAEAIDDPFQAPSVAAVAPVMQGQAALSFAGETANIQIQGITSDFDTVRNRTVKEGEYINEAHILGRASVVLLGIDTADKLFGRTSGLVGETVRIEGQPFRVIGILEERGGSSFNNEDDIALVPISTAQTRLLRRSQPDAVDMLMVQAASAEVVPDASQEIAQILRSRHRTEIGADDFTILTQQDFLSTAETITGVLTIFLGGIAAISLLVGGIGIMNIMLVSVTERTREIGLRKALGARKTDILIQFLTESSVLSLFGGLIGIALGWAISLVVGQIAAASDTPIVPAISIDIILLATLFSTAVGLFFGIYPANRAANLEPVEALRYE